MADCTHLLNDEQTDFSVQTVRGNTCERALLFVNSHKPDARIVAEEIIEALNRRSIAAFSVAFDRTQDFKAGESYDISFSLGGDGTVLYTARAIASLKIPILPINIGTVGFIAAVHPGEWSSVFEKWLAGDAVVSRRLMLELQVARQGKIVFSAVFLNDAVVSASGIAKIIRLQVVLDGLDAPPSGSSPAVGLTDWAEPFDEGAGQESIRLGHYRSDGLIVATPTGSTAYSVAAGGPILDPEIEAIIINPICPFTLSNRPIVVPAHETVTIEVEHEQRSGVLLTVDGQVTEPLEPGDRILIRKAPYDARLIASDRRVFYKALRTKLNWSGGSVAGGGVHA
ncbi:NAD kinase [Spirochaetia bacterium]|nr:NAD kinase [Spirochaetia bacterium]